MAQYAIGIDFGTLSGRAVLIDTQSGEELCSAAQDYPHGVMSSLLPDGTALPDDYALQHPQDYLDVLHTIVSAVLEKSGVPAGHIIGVGVDVTASTVLPVKADGTPLCFLPEYAKKPHAYVKLWKHHAAQPEADLINAAAAKQGAKWLSHYGGKTSSEWLFPKVWQVLNEAPDIYRATDVFIEAADWLVWMLTGVQTRNSCSAGYKALWSQKDGYPPETFFASLDSRLTNIVQEKMSCPVLPIGSKAGEVSKAGALLTGLLEGTPVAVGNVDAHVGFPAAGVNGEGKMVAIMGTSTCHLLLSKTEREVPGICGIVKDGIMPGYYGYEGGQSCVGDLFAWFVENSLPASYVDEAKTAGMNVHAYLRERASKLRPGESGLIALDWWNGNRSVLMDANLTGLLIGQTLSTKPEEIYRALLEATAFGTRKIIETFRGSGVPVEEYYATGGIAQKDPLMMQIYADVLDMPVMVTGGTQGPARGAAIFGAVAAGSARGGYDTVGEAAKIMGKPAETSYCPIKENTKRYERLYAEYCTLHDYFGHGGNDVMRRLKAIRAEATGFGGEKNA